MALQQEFPATVVSVSGSGDVAWTDPSNATANDFNVAQVFLGSGNQSEEIEATDFGFSIPSTATIDGIRVYVSRYSMGTVTDALAKLISGSSYVGDDKSVGTTWPTMETLESFGGETDDWNASPTPSMVNGSGFGCRLQCESASGGMALINFIEIDITYTDSGSSGGPPQVVTVRSRAMATARPRSSGVFAPPLFVAAPAAPTYFPLVVFPGNAPAISRRQATARVAGIAIAAPIAADPPAAVPTLPTVVVLGGLQSRLPRVAPRSQIVTVPSADPDPSPPPPVIVVRSRPIASPRPHSVIAYWPTAGNGECRCEPGGVVLVGSSFGVTIVESEGDAAFGAVVVVSIDRGRAVRVGRCDC